ncbi:hypothetical protein BDV96DRAFT_108315 [Lophiotrema nucula]|uniref:Uncharacterized protein n=1 Tax=Lophiotrema nucula TaxID=690887 RepID=A0A6A5Z3T9_9PLEO|nr:hypothetical protein BDV96DRAFT_108315 [Lophiotrema nucula]
MSFFSRHLILPTSLNLVAIASSTYYLRSHHIYNLEEQEARLDEIEGTLRGHIGLIEDALDRIEGKANAGKQEELYGKRGRDENEGKKEGKKKL